MKTLTESLPSFTNAHLKNEAASSILVPEKRMRTVILDPARCGTALDCHQTHEIDWGQYKSWIDFDAEL